MRYDLELLKRLLEERRSTTRNMDVIWYNLPRQGRAKIRFLPPPKENPPLPGVLVYRHWNIGGEGNRITCLKTWGEECPICKTLEEIGERTLIEEFGAFPRAFFNVLVVEDDSQGISDPYTVRVLGASEYNLYWLAECLLNPDIGDITDPWEGHDVIFQRKSANGPFERFVVPQKRPIAETEEEIRRILDSRYDLENLFSRPSEESLMEAVEFIRKQAKENLEKIKEKLSSPSPPPPEKEELPEQEESPKGLPECFGKYEGGTKCLACPHEVDCLLETQKRQEEAK